MGYKQWIPWVINWPPSPCGFVWLDIAWAWIFNTTFVHKVTDRKIPRVINSGFHKL